ncbi:Fc.00g054690.m01.CDS01 [Cosmosporella sp. VM-42]
MFRVARIAQVARRWKPSTHATCSIAPFAAGGRSTFYSTEATPSTPNPRWLSDLQSRLKKLQLRNLAPEQAAEVTEISSYVQSNWLELLAGREGFLTGKQWRGLDRHAVVWGDMDSMVGDVDSFYTKQPLTRHVNNVVYNRYAESARVNWLQTYADTSAAEHRNDWIELMTPRGVGLILRSIKTDYKFPMDYPDYTTVLHKLTTPPTYDSDHVLLEAVILSERFRRPAARCFEDIVVYDYKKAQKTPLKGFMVDELRKTYELQQSSRLEVEEKIHGLIQAVEKVEASAA